MYQQPHFSQVESFPFICAEDYNSFESIVKTFPHLSHINQNYQWNMNKNIDGVVIRSANDDNVHKSIKYGIWTTTQKNRIKLNQLYMKGVNEKKQIYLFFSVVKSGMFEGVARLTSGLNEDLFPYWWDDQNHKFRDYFNIQWIYIKDVNYNHLEGLLNVEGEDVTKSKDCDLLDSSTTLQMLEIFQNKPLKNKWIFNDFALMDNREVEYTRKIQRPYNDQMGFNFMSPYMQFGHQPPMMPFPPQMMKPVQKLSHSELGFQMNPISRNRKKQK